MESTTTQLTPESIEGRLIAASEAFFPITEDMCPSKKIGAKNNRWAFVIKMKKEIAAIQSNNLKMIVLNELEAKATNSKKL